MKKEVVDVQEVADQIRHIFVVGNESTTRNALVAYLIAEGYDVTTTNTWDNVLDTIVSDKPDAVVLDHIISDVTDSIDMCKAIRKHSDVPLIILSERDEVEERIIALELGADDYLTKPYNLRELVARLRAIFRHRPNYMKKETVQDNKVYYFEDIKVDERRRVCSVGQTTLYLTNNEYLLLTYLIKHAGDAHTRSDLIKEVWKVDYVGYERKIDNLVKRLRKVLTQAGSQLVIRTIRGHGYCLEGELRYSEEKKEQEGNAK